MDDFQKRQILIAVGAIDGAIDVVDAMSPPWHTNDDALEDLEAPLQYLRTAREMLKLLTLQDHR